MAVTLRFETNASSRCFESNRLNDLNEARTAYFRRCENVSSVVFVGDEGLQNARCRFEGAGDSARAASAGHPGDGKDMRFFVHG